MSAPIREQFIFTVAKTETFLLVKVFICQVNYYEKMHLFDDRACRSACCVLL